MDDLAMDIHNYLLEKSTRFQGKNLVLIPITEVVKKFGGQYLARGGEYTVVEGEDNYPRIILIKFPSYEKALEWYHSEDYKPIKDIRLQNSKGLNIIVKGV